MTEYAPSQPAPPPGSDFERYIREEWPRYVERAKREREADDAARGRAGTFPCGWGGTPRCAVRLERRGLCDEHRSVVRAIFETPATDKAKTKGAPPAKSHKIDPSDVLTTTDKRVPADVRAAHAARWLHEVGEPVTRADFVRVAGIEDPVNGASRGVLRVAVENGWVKRGPGGSVVPGDTRP